MPVTGRDVSIVPPFARTSSAYASATRRKSTMPVLGLHSARMPMACGSSSRIRSGPTTSSPGTPFSMARSRSASNRGSSDSSSATTSLPVRSTAMPCSSQNASSSRLPSRHRRAFSEPGA